MTPTIPQAVPADEATLGNAFDVRVTAEVRPRPSPRPNRHERRRYAALSRSAQTR